MGDGIRDLCGEERAPFLNRQQRGVAITGKGDVAAVDGERLRLAGGSSVEPIASAGQIHLAAAGDVGGVDRRLNARRIRRRAVAGGTELGHVKDLGLELVRFRRHMDGDQAYEGRNGKQTCQRRHKASHCFIPLQWVRRSCGSASVPVALKAAATLAFSGPAGDARRCNERVEIDPRPLNLKTPWLVG